MTAFQKILLAIVGSVFFLSLFAVFSAEADVFYLKSGRKVEGKVIQRTPVFWRVQLKKNDRVVELLQEQVIRIAPNETLPAEEPKPKTESAPLPPTVTPVRENNIAPVSEPVSNSFDEEVEYLTNLPQETSPAPVQNAPVTQQGILNNAEDLMPDSSKRNMLLWGGVIALSLLLVFVKKRKAQRQVDKELESVGGASQPEPDRAVAAPRDTPTVTASENASESIEPESAPLLPKNLLLLYFKPTKFFSEQIGRGKTPFVLFVCWILGMASAIDQIDRKMMQADMGSSGSEALVALFSGSWLNFWLFVILGGAISGAFAWLIGGWWYGVRVRWSGDKEADPRLGRVVYIYASFVWALPSLIYVIVQSFFYPNYIAAWQAEEMGAMLLLIFPVWACVVGYKGVVNTFQVKRGLARTWFLILPILGFCLFFVSVALMYAFLVPE